MRHRILLFALAVSLAAAPAFAQLQVGLIRGVVLDTQRKPLPATTVRLLDSQNASVRTAVTDAEGRFQMTDVAPGGYVIRVESGDAVLLSRPLVVRGALPIEVTLETGPTIHEDVVVRGDAGSNTAEHPLSIAGDTIRNVVGGTPGQQVQNAIASLPGWMAEDNGLLHVRGVDDGLLYVQDGIPVYERLDRVFGMPPNPSAIASMEVLNGYIPPEFGFKSGGVIQVRSESGQRGRWTGSVGAGAADFRTGSVDGFAAGPLKSLGGLMFTLSHERSARFLDPVDPDNLHNEGRAWGGSGQWTQQQSNNLFTVTVQAGANRYDVPHSLEQDEAGQDQRQESSQRLFSGTWQRVWSPSTVSQVSGYRRRADSSLIGSAFDTPVTADGRRINTRQGALWSVTHQRGAHTLKGGGEMTALTLDERFAFAVTDPSEAEEAGLSPQAIAFTESRPFMFADRATPALWSVFAQDEFRPSSRVTLNFGVRFDHSRMLVSASQISPRLGASVRLREGSTLRASLLRLFQPPQAEYLLLGSSPQAFALSPAADDDSGGGASISPERQTALEVSLTQRFARGWELGGTLWRRRVENVGDPNVFFGTTVFVPNSVDRQHAWGADLSIDSPAGRGWSAGATYSTARLVQFAPVTGGLFLEDDLLELEDGESFIPDHDQRHALFATVSLADRARGLRASASYRYRTGTPVGLEAGDADDVVDRPGGEVVDLETGRVKPLSVLSLQVEWRLPGDRRHTPAVLLWMDNLTDQRYAYNFGNPFSGTHFGAPRRIGVTVRVGIGR